MTTLTASLIPTRRAMRESFDFGSTGLERCSAATKRVRGHEPGDPELKRRPVILLAEDDGPMRGLLSSQLRRDGYEVIACRDGMELVERIKRFESHQTPIGVDLVISDVRMPLISGLELLELLNETPLRIPVILISAFGDIETRNEASKRDAVAFFSKPFDIDELRAAVRCNLNFEP
jgi:DNA-binding NtrC family response regulator